MRFRKPVPVGEPILVRGRVTWHRRNVLGVEAQVLNEAGTVLVQGEGSFVSRGTLDAAADRRNPAADAERDRKAQQYRQRVPW